MAYILTRPLGASFGDFFSQPPADGGLGLGTVVTTFLFLGTILAVVVYLSRSRVDQPALAARRRLTEPQRAAGASSASPCR